RSVGEPALHAGIPVLAHALSTHDLARFARYGDQPHLYLAAGCNGLAEMYHKDSTVKREDLRILKPAILMPDKQVECQTTEHTLGILWTGHINADAGLMTLIDAVAQLRRKEHDLQLVLIGDGPDVRAVWEHARQMQVQHCISLIDEPRLWDQAMYGADVYVVPACQNELSLAPLLAMAMGKIVLASRDQVADWFVEDQTTWLFTPGSAVELAYYLTRVLEKDRRVPELRKSTTEYVRTHHVVSHLVTELIEVYRQISVDSESVEQSLSGSSKP
ncbi:MAG: glycosyltransferase, partial [Planctomycetota bacterium]